MNLLIHKKLEGLIDVILLITDKNCFHLIDKIFKQTTVTFKVCIPLKSRGPHGLFDTVQYVYFILFKILWFSNNEEIMSQQGKSSKLFIELYCNK